MFRLLCFCTVFLWCGVVWAQTPKAAVSDVCQTDSDCIEGSVCVNVDPANNLSLCLLLCPTGQCLTGEPCVALPNGKKVCRCTKGVPCRSGFPCFDGYCPGSYYCHATGRSCPGSGQLLCFQPIAQSKWGVCLAPCQSDSDCPPPGTRCLPYNGKKACYCTKDSDCKSGLICLDYHCHTPCTSDKDCSKKEECTGKICEPKGASPPPDSGAVEVNQDTSSEPLPDSSEATSDASSDSGPGDSSVSVDASTPEPLPEKGSIDTLGEPETPWFEASDPFDFGEQKKLEPTREVIQERSTEKVLQEEKIEVVEKFDVVVDVQGSGSCGCSQSEPLAWYLLGFWLILVLGYKR